MGYSTDFWGRFTLDRKLDEDTFMLLKKLAETRRMARKGLGPEYGIEGEFYVEGSGDFGQADEKSIIDYNKPPRTQPGLWCQWVPTADGMALEWDQNEKFYNYVEWLQYIVSKVLKPRGYALSGEVEWQGEERTDTGRIVVKNNEIQVLQGKLVFGDDK